VFVIIILSATSCNSDYLDKMPQAEGYDFEAIFSDSINYRNFCEYLVINPFFLHLQNGVKPYGSYDDISDNSISTALFSGVPSVQCQIGNFYAMRTNGDAPMANNSTWDEIWKHVRIANHGLRNISYYPGSEVSKNKILGLCYFYRGYAYMELNRRWGGMPYFYSPIDASENMDFPRLNIQETYQLAALDFDSAAMFLQDVIPLSEFQHPTRVAALAMKSRCLLYAASDLARYENGTGKNLWEEAALSADIALKASEDAGYELVPWDSYYYLFKDNQDEIYSKEVLFGRRAQINWGSDAYINTIRPPGTLSGKYGVAVNQQLVDDFEMQTTGLPVSDPESGYQEQNPYINRDPRFEFNIIYNGSTVMTRKIQIWQMDEGTKTAGSPDCKISAGGVPDMGYTQTGYYAKKWMGQTWNTTLPQLWPYIRLAEIYLNFAEAANEAWNSPNAKDGRCRYSAEEAINIVRKRANMPGVHAKFMEQAKFRERVRKERRIEFCFEEHRLFDLRRWKIGTQPENRDIWRMKITKLATGYDANAYPTGFRYEKEFLMRRVFEDRHNLFVIKLDDTRIGPNFKQNPGW
ncbi:MAG: RagB/SusD family nutrient uptake outer membrane protein, partial [Dysgonamonadaceae bacterium]|nr:RagB/SusD family nutrient uptake outer membrane protein [Dysgonamonadaceae bacterium]